MAVSNYTELARHVGHQIVCAGYGFENEWVNVYIECETCDEVLFDFDRYAEK